MGENIHENLIFKWHKQSRKLIKTKSTDRIRLLLIQKFITIQLIANRMIVEIEQ
jgi:hypothetical protein